MAGGAKNEARESDISYVTRMVTVEKLTSVKREVKTEEEGSLQLDSRLAVEVEGAGAGERRIERERSFY